MPRKHPEPRKPIKPTKQKEEPYFILPKQEAPGCPIQRPGGFYAPHIADTLQLYHRTSRVAARRIMRHGFKDSTNQYMEQRLHAGIWLSSVPGNYKGASGDVLLRVDAGLDEGELSQYEWIEKGNLYREWLVPAAIINPHMRVTVVRRWE